MARGLASRYLREEVLVTVVGNYPKIPNRPRPARLRNAYSRLDRGEITAEEFARVQDEVTEEVLREQAEAGVDLVTDGQVRWEDEVTYLAGGMAGIEINGLTRFFDTNTYYREPIIHGDVAFKAPITARDYRFAAEKSPRPVKAVLTGPYTLARLSKDEYYHDIGRLAQAFATALNQEARALQAEDPPLIQFNEPALTWHPEDVTLADKAWCTLLEGVTAETAVYFYFGLPGPALEAAVGCGFSLVGVDATRPGAIEALKKNRPKKLGLGVMDSRTTRLESVENIVGCIRQAAAVVPAADIHVGPNMGLEFLPREQAQAKLARLGDAVNRAREEIR